MKNEVDVKQTDNYLSQNSALFPSSVSFTCTRNLPQSIGAQNKQQQHQQQKRKEKGKKFKQEGAEINAQNIEF